jgi:Domain of Unknown Function (DUF1080)
MLTWSKVNAVSSLNSRANYYKKKQNYNIMKSKKIRLATLLIFILLAIPGITIAQEKTKKSKKYKSIKSEKIQLFNGVDLSNWVLKLKDASIDPAKVFAVKQGVIHISGDPFGYMRTKETYSGYKLHVEWRWPGEPGNSGVFVNAQEPDTIWLKCIECQLKAGNAGDFVCMNGADMNERTDKSKIFVNKLVDHSEKPAGEWNTMKVICKSNIIEVYVNGVLQNRGTNVSPDRGHICLQSEGKEVEFRNVYLTKLEK